MANYREDIVNIDLECGNIHRSFMKHTIGVGDEMADRIGVRVFRNGQPVQLTGSCKGYFIRQDGGTIPITNGVINGNLAYVTLIDTCYAQEGVFSLAIKVEKPDEKVTIRIVDGMVTRTSTSIAVDPGTIIPSVEDLIEAIEDAVATIPPEYSDLVDAVKGTYWTATQMTAGEYGTFLEIPYGDYLCYFEDQTDYGFPDYLGQSFYLHVSEKAYGTGYAYKTFYAYSNDNTAAFTMAGNNASPSSLPEWNRMLMREDPLIAGKALLDADLTEYGTFLDVPQGCWFVYINTAGSYGFTANLGQSFYLEVSGAASDYRYKTFKAYGNNGAAMYAVGGTTSSSSNLPKWNRMDANQTGITDTEMTSLGFANFVELPQGTYEVYLSEAGAKGFPVALGQSFVLTVSKQTHSNYAYKNWTAYGNNGTALYAVAGNSTSAENPPTWYYLTSNNGGSSVGGVNKFSDALAPVKLLLLGDSITMGAGASAESKSDPITLTVDGLTGSPKTIYQLGDHWAGRFKAYVEEEYPNVTVLNHGWGGISIAQLAAHMDDFVPEDTTHCIIGLGVNSEGQTSFDGPIATIINYLLEKDIQVFAWTSWLGTHPNLSNINTAGRVQAALMHAYRNVGIEPLPVYSIAKRYIDEEELAFMDVMEWQPDDEIVHPNDLGHLILFRIIREGFGF